jgi:hypothetical protein
VRFFTIACLTCLILSVAFFDVLLSPTVAHAQACLPVISDSATPTATPQQATPQSSSPSIVINEVLPLPRLAQLNCTLDSAVPDGPWVELYNTQAQPQQLVHAFLESGSNTNPFLITNTYIPAHGFIVVFPSTDSTFISTLTSTLKLKLNDTLLNQVDLPTSPLPQDTSYARIPDGDPSWTIFTAPTIGQSNNPVIATATPQPQKKPTTVATPKTEKKTPTNNSTSKQTQPSSSSSSPTSSMKSQMPQLQPNWKAVNLPTQIATSTPTSTNVSSMADTIHIPDTPDILKKLAISLLIIALALVLWWCRKLFINRNPVPDEPSHS